ncbi:MAG: hypothetical protein C6W57_05115 [Caldibacillus debilis]|nr:MAG: hypothetical protein C6W57_05115 [Caldibacillus debilis]
MLLKSETAESRPKGSRGKSRAACGLGRRREKKDFSFRNGPPGFANKKAVRHSRSVSEETGKECSNGSFRIFSRHRMSRIGKRPEIRGSSSGSVAFFQPASGPVTGMFQSGKQFWMISVG